MNFHAFIFNMPGDAWVLLCGVVLSLINGYAAMRLAGFFAYRTGDARFHALSLFFAAIVVVLVMHLTFDGIDLIAGQAFYLSRVVRIVGTKLVFGVALYYLAYRLLWNGMGTE